MAIEKEIVSLKDAMVRGLKHYFTGIPCRNGHAEKRQVSDRHCVACNRANAAAHAETRKAAKRRWGKNNPEKYKEQSARWRRNNPEKAKIKGSKWAKENPEKNRDRVRAYHSANPGKNYARVRAWEIANPEAVIAWRQMHRSRKANAEGYFSVEDINRIRKQQRNRCAYCKISFERVAPHVDHIKPLAKGGSNWPNNIQLLCPPCNMSKNAADPIVFAQRKGYLL